MIARVAELVGRWFLPAVLAAAAVGLVWPGGPRALVDHRAIDVVLAVLVLSSALTIPTGAATHLRDIGVRLVAVLVAVAVVLPLVALALSRLVDPGPLRDSVLAVGVAPAEVASVAVAGIAGGDVSVAAALLIGSTLLSVVVAGPTLGLLAGHGVASGHVMTSLAEVVGAPMVLGLGLKRAVGVPERAEPGIELVGLVAVLVLVWLVAAQAHLAYSYVAVAAVLVAMVGVSAGAGWALGRGMGAADRRSITLHCSMRDFAIASGIAAAAFGPRATGPLGLYGVIVMAWGAVVASVTTRRDRG